LRRDGKTFSGILITGKTSPHDAVLRRAGAIWDASKVGYVARAGNDKARSVAEAAGLDIIELEATEEDMVPVTGDDQRQGDVVEHGAVEQQVMVLEDKADLAAQVGDAAAADARDILPVDEDLSAGGVFDHRDQLEQGAFTGARMPGEKGHVAGFEVEADVAQGLEPARVALADVVELDHREINTVELKTSSTFLSTLRRMACAKP